ncbi:hypothetical protein AWC31_07040 [Mycolicibacterium wolinskyi]|uniref:Uncharacterized protein n=1 Tax=Mycolicibacterium wolinskyi TaxID=59750 RepID=A0A1X2EUZ4_9MYCO|nr:hypothetical protein AWC31_07040 [Mycolicibacterium wolinskyi]
MGGVYEGTLEESRSLLTDTDKAVDAGFLLYAHDEVFVENGVKQRRIVMKPADGSPEMILAPGLYVAVASTGAIRVLSEDAYHAEFDAE